MIEKLLDLIDLQSLETEINRIQMELSQIPGMLEALDANFFEIKTKLSDANASAGEVKKGYRTKEIEVETNLSRIKKSRDHMDSVKTNKEYQAILKEIDDITVKNSVIEDEMIGLLENIEMKDKEIRLLKQEMAQIEKTVLGEKEAINQKGDELRRRLLDLESQLEAQYKVVDAEIFNTYKKVKQRVGAIAIVPVNNAVCKGCHLTIPPQMYNELHRQDSLKFCPHCHRMIYWLSENLTGRSRQNDRGVS